MKLRIALAAFLLSGSVAGQEAPRLMAKPLLMFNQSLYYGTFVRPRALAFDRENRELWIADAGASRIGIYRTDGAELYSFVSTEHLRDPMRIVIGPKGSVAVLQGNRSSIKLFNYRGDLRGEIVPPGLTEKPLIGAIAYDSAGQLYVAEQRTNEIYVYRADGTLKFQFGSNGSDEGQFMGVCAITVANGTIYVLDQRAISVQLFDLEGNFIRGWGKHEMGAQNFSLPSGMAVDSKGRVVVTDELRQQVKVFSGEGALLAVFGGLGDGLGQLAFPTDVTVDDKDRIYVAERRTARVQVFELAEPAAGK